MLTPLVVLLRSIRLMCCGHRAIALENLALRQQVAALKRTVNRLKLGVIQFDGTGDQVITVKLSWSSSWLPDTLADGRTTS